MIKSTKDKRLEAVRAGKAPKGFTADIVARAQRRLAHLDASVTLDDSQVTPSNNLEALQGDRKGQHSICINGQLRICFESKDGDAFEVEIVDYH